MTFWKKNFGFILLSFCFFLGMGTGNVSADTLFNVHIPGLKIFQKLETLDPSSESLEAPVKDTDCEGIERPVSSENKNKESSLSADLLPNREVLGQVVCLSDFPLDDMEVVRTEIQNLQKDLSDYLGIPESKEKVVICVFQKRESYVAFLKKNCPKAPLNRPALYVKDNGPGYVFLQLDDKLILNLRHEMTHALINSTHKNVPIWLDEGLAKYFETPAGERGNSNPFLEPVTDRAESLLTPVPSLAALERMKGIDDMRGIEYRNSWAWIHFLIHYSPETQQILGHYLKTLQIQNQEGIDTRQAEKIQASAPLTTLLKSEIPDYKKQYRNHFANWTKR